MYKKGFTIIELMVAISVFSLLLLLIATTVMQLSRYFFKGIAGTQAQEASRAVIDEVTRSIQFGGEVPRTPWSTNPTPTKQFGSPSQFTANSICIGNLRYSFALDVQVDDSVVSGKFDNSTPTFWRRARHAMWRDTTQDATCPPLDLSLANPSASAPSGTSTNGQEMIPQHMRLNSNNGLAVMQVGTSPLWNITVGVVYGDNDLLERDPGTGAITGCTSVQRGGQFCGISTLISSVSARLPQVGL